MQEREQIRNEFSPDKCSIILLSSSLFKQDAASQQSDRRWIRSIDFDQIIIDEAHQLKSKDSASSQRISKLRASGRWLLTGTPIQNDVNELLSILDFVWPDVFADETDGASGLVLEDEETLRLVRSVASLFYLRRLKADVITDLPPKICVTESIDLAPRQREVYDQLLREFVREFSKDAAAKEGKEKEGKENGAAAVKRKTTSQGAGRGQNHKISALRKAANHPLLLRRHYDGELFEKVALRLHRSSYFGPDATEKRIREEMLGYCDYEIHQICKENKEVADLAMECDENGFPNVPSAKLEYLVTEKGKNWIFFIYKKKHGDHDVDDDGN